MSISASNTGDLRPYLARDLIEGATRRCGIGPEKLTSEIVEASLDELNLLFTELLNRGVQLWKRQKMVLPLYLNTASVPLPVGINRVDRLSRRSLTRQTGTPSSSAGGVAANAFDGDLDTSCIQTSDNGDISCVFTDATQITNVGVLFGTDMSLSFFVEYSVDGSTNWTSLDAWTGAVTSGSWVWLDLDGAPSALGWRIRASGASVPLVVTELYLGNNPSEIPLDPWNLDEYQSMPNKTTGGQVVNYYQQRNLDTVDLLVWPVPDSSAVFDTLVVWTLSYIDTVSEMTQTIDFPRRWYNAVTSMLARRLCRSLPEADLKRYDLLKNEEQEAVELAEGEERDYSNTNYDMGIGAYTA